MIDASWGLFAVASLALIVTPGQDMALILSHALSRGTGAGIVTAAGVCIGLTGHTVLASIGLGALLRASATLFLAVKLIGAGYLIYLGLQLLRTGRARLRLDAGTTTSWRRLFLDGALTNLANPKIAIFYLAFLPQFVPPSAPSPALSVLALGLLYAGLAFLVKAPLGLIAGTLSGWLHTRRHALVWIYRVSGTVLVALGLRLALEPYR